MNVKIKKLRPNQKRFKGVSERIIRSCAILSLIYEAGLVIAPFYVSLVSTVDFVFCFFILFMFRFGIILFDQQRSVRAVPGYCFVIVCVPLGAYQIPLLLHPELTPSSAVSSSSSSNLPLSSRIYLRQKASDQSLASSSRQHSNAATANSSSISLNKSYSFTSRPLKHHSFISEVPDVRHMERALLGLLEDFHSGKLKAFGRWLSSFKYKGFYFNRILFRHTGSGCTMEQMTSIREQQESLAKLHFDLGNEASLGSNAGNNEAQSQTNMGKLVAKLEQLSFSIEKLHSSNVEQ